MEKRFVSIWFRYLKTDWFTIRYSGLSNVAFVLSAASHGKMVITAANKPAQQQGIFIGMAVADARAIFPVLKVLDDKPEISDKLLKRLAEWCIRFTPYVAADSPDGLMLDVSGCAHLWGGNELYLKTIIERLNERGYYVKAAMADTPGCARAVARFGKNSVVIEKGRTAEALLPLPAEALGIEAEITERLYKLGLRAIQHFISMPRSVLRRRFGQQFIKRLNQALGYEDEIIQPVQPIEPYQERLHSLEPIVTPTGIEIALKRLLETLCSRLQKENKGLRCACFKCYRVDGKTKQVNIGTNRPSHHVNHLFKLFEEKISSIEPDMGIELFVLEAQKVEDHLPLQENIWNSNCDLDNPALAELLDRLACKIGADKIYRYLPDEHYWPERSFKPALSLDEKPTTGWRTDKPRPLQLLQRPEPIMVTAPIPDYPSMLFRYKNKLHKIIKADGPERIEQEWWLQQGQHRDYYCVEDEEGNRYWLFRLGHYSDESYQWFIHGFFA